MKLPFPITEFHKSASIICFDPSKGLILGVSRKDDHTDFTLPGGKCDENETFKETALRELREETGYIAYPDWVYEQFSDFHVNHRKPGIGYFCVVFYVLARDINRAFLPEVVGGLVKWCTPEELLATKSFPDFTRKAFMAAGLVQESTTNL